MYKKIMIVFLVVSVLISSLALPSFAEEKAMREYIYVALNGSDSSSGEIDSPLATLDAARDKIRAMKKEGISPAKGFVVYVRGGAYEIKKGFHLTKEDSGTSSAPVTYRAYPGEEVNFVGGANIPYEAFKPVEDPQILSRIVDKESRSKILCADLHALGFYDFGKPFWPGAYSYLTPGYPKPRCAAPELFIDGDVQILARYPNNDYMKISKVVHEGAFPANWQIKYKDEPDYVPPDKQDITDTMIIQPDNDRLLKWTKVPEGDALMYGYYRWDWADHTVPLKKVDTNNLTLESTIPNYYAPLAGQRFYVFNLLEEIDSPGEYYIDRENGILYTYPKVNLKNANVYLSLLEDNLVNIDGAEYVNFKGINMTAMRGSAYLIKKSKYITITDSEISYTADKAVQILGEESFRCGVDSCYIHDVNGGVVCESGSMENLTPGECYATNCKIERFSRITKTYNAAFHTGHVGNFATYNEICDGPHLGVMFSGNNHSIMYNDIHDVVKEADDMGAIYAGRSWIYRGTKIKYNYIHDMKSSSSGGIGIIGIYLDDKLPQVYMIGNIFSDIEGIGVLVNSGRDNVFMNNIMVNVKKTDLFLNALLPPNPESKVTEHKQQLEKFPFYNNAIWKKTYPALVNLIENESGDERLLPKNNVVENNVSVNCGAPLITQAFKNNSEVKNNIKTMNPGFYDMDNKNYLLNKDSEIFTKIPEFRQLPFTRMGTYTKRAMKRIEEAVCLCVDSNEAYVNGEKTKIDKANDNIVPEIIDGTTFVPIRFLAESLGMDVSFNDAMREITIQNSQNELKLTLDDTALYKNGEKVEMTKAAFSENGRTLIPLRAVSEALSKKVFWDDRGLIVVSDEDLFNKQADDDLIKYIHRTLSIY